MVLHNISKRRAFLWIGALFVLTSFWYMIMPKTSPVSIPSFHASVGIMFISTWIYFISQKKKNYFDFDTLFVCMYFFVGFFSTFFYNSILYPYLFLHFKFDDHYINVANWLFVLGIQAYYLGRLSKVKICRHPTVMHEINSSFLACIFVILLISFLALGGLNYYESVYNNVDLNANGIVIQIEMLLTTCIITIISTELYNRKLNSNYPIKWSIWIGILAYCCLLLQVGNRTLPSYFILASLGLYTLFFKTVKLKLMFLLLCVGFISMWGIAQLRSGSDLRMVSNTALFATDMTINSRNTYIAMEYIDDFGHTYGKTMLSGLFSIIPFGSYMLGIDKQEFGSAEVLTNYSYANMEFERSRIGLGTNIIADIYLSFGLIGVLVLMYILGKLVNKYSKKAMELNYYSVIVYSVIMAFGVFGVRTGYTQPFRMLVWSLIIAYLNKYFTTKKFCKK